MNKEQNIPPSDSKGGWEEWKENFLRHLSDWSYYSADEELENIKKSLLQNRDKEIVEKLEGMKKEGCEHDQDGACFAGKYDNELCGESYNKALSDAIKVIRE